MNEQPILSIRVLNPNHKSFLDRLPDALGAGWSQADELPWDAETHLFIRDRPGMKLVTLHLRRADPHGFEIEQIDCTFPLSLNERRSALCDFASSMSDRLHNLDIVMGVSLKHDVNIHHLMDSTASRRLESFVAEANPAGGTCEDHVRDLFQHFIRHLHCSEHQVTTPHIYFWALDRHFTPDVAAHLAHQFRFGLECLEGYDIYLEANQSPVTEAA